MKRFTPATDTRRRLSLARPTVVASAIAAIFLVVAAPAVAQDPTSTQYENSTTNVTDAGGPSSPSTPSSGLRSTVVGGLPFTGLDLIALIAVALAFTSVGFALRRMTIARRA